MGEKNKLLDDTEERSYKVFLAYNEKLLIKAEEDCNEEKIKLYTDNIKHYKKLLGIKDK
jgi:hypothetical protein